MRVSKARLLATALLAAATVMPGRGLNRNADISSLIFSAAPTPPWINKHGYLLRSIRRSVHCGGNRT